MDPIDPPQSPRKRQKLEITQIEPSGTAVTIGDNPNQNGSLRMELDKNESHAEVVTGAIPVSDAVNNGAQSKEVQVGITELVNPNLPGFSGVLKKRYTDFLVNEILPSGEVVHLNDLKAPKPEKGWVPVAGIKTQSLTEPELVKVQDEPIVKSAAIVQSQDGEMKPPGIASTPALSQEPNQTDQNPQEAVVISSDPISEVKIAQHEADEGLEENLAQTEHEKDSGDEVSVSVEPSPSKNAFPEPNKDLNRWQAFAKDQPGFQLSAENAATLNSYFSPEVVAELVAIFNRVVDSPHRKVKEYGVVNAGKITDREKRTHIHKDLRKIFSSRLESATDENGFLMVTAAVSTGSMDSRNDRGGRGQGHGQSRSRGRGGRGGRDSSSRTEQQHRRLTWQELGGDYLHFTIYKENRDTMEVIAQLTRALQRKPQDFQFAGTKDRRAITAQRASVFRVRAEQMVSAGRNLWHASIGNFQHQKQKLDLGDLMGNEFVITLRDCHFDGPTETNTGQQLHLVQVVQDAAKQLSDDGFINYYGLQRFGTFATRTDSIGLKMLKGDLKGAVAGILAFEPGALAAAKNPMFYETTFTLDDKTRAWAIDKFQSSGQSHPAIESLPKKFSAEAAIIRHLGNSTHSNDFKGALQSIPRNLRLMYVHAYQSLVWNLAASTRWARFGKEVVEGDLVLVNDHKDKEDDNYTVETKEELDFDGTVIIHPAAHDSSRSEEDRFERARALTAEEAKSGRYTIMDVVLPTPGFDVLYPANEIGEFYTTYMKSEAGGGLDPNDMRRAWKEVSLSGNYRKLIARPLKPIEVEIKSYVYEDEQFVETDMDILKNKQQQRPKHARPATTVVNPIKTSNEDVGNDATVTLDDAENTNDETALSTKPVNDIDHDPQPELEQNKPSNGFGKDVTGATKEEHEASDTINDSSGVANETTVNLDTTTTEVEGAQDVCKLAVILKLQLGSSQYATMALRELMKEGGLRVYKPEYAVPSDGKWLSPKGIE